MFYLLNHFLVLKKIIGAILVSCFGVIYSLGGSTDIQGVYYNKDSYVTYSFYAPTKKLGLDEFIDKRDKFEICLAKNEYEAGVIAIRSKLCSERKKYNIRFSEFRNEQGEILPSRVYEEKYVKCYSNKDYGTYPEIMEEIPHDRTVRDKILCYARNWPYYIEVHAVNGTRPGIYKAEIICTTGDKTEFIAEITARVWDFTLNTASACSTAFGLNKNHIAKAYNLDPESEAATEIYKQYYEYLLDRRMSPYNLPYDILDPRADSYMSDPRLTSFMIPCPEDDELLIKYYEKVKSNPAWAEKGYFYPADEPGNAEYKATADRLDKLCPGYHMITTFGDFTCEADGRKYQIPEIAAKSDRICPISSDYSDKNFRDQIENLRMYGSDIWWYVCSSPGGDYCNVMTHFDGIKARMLFWQQKSLNINGFLYWETAFWPDVDSPWTDQHTSTRTGLDTFGDGSLFYPGEKGPVPSLRLLLMSAGIEDFEMLTMAENIFGREYAEDKISKVSYNLTDYTLDDNLLWEVRKTVGNDIEKALAGQ